MELLITCRPCIISQFSKSDTGQNGILDHLSVQWGIRGIG